MADVPSGELGQQKLAVAEQQRWRPMLNKTSNNK
jgi:hypothetical protein